MQISIEPPSDKQKLFLSAKTRFVAYGGARGGGKSWSVRTKATLLGVKHAGIRMLLLRRTYPELRENHILPLIGLLKGVASYREGEKAFTFINGSRLKLGYLDNDNDVLQYQGQEYDVIFLDEATQFTEYMHDTLTACVRGANSFPKRMYFTCNPGGIGHEWVKRLFVDRQYRDNENPEDYTFIKATVYDNKALMESDHEYVKALESLPESLRKPWLYGDWNSFVGQYFKEFNPDIHVVEPFEIPSHWKIYTSMDYGLDMLAYYWIAVDEQRNAYVIKELYKSDLIVSNAVAAIRAIEVNKPVLRLAPPDLWNSQSSIGKSTALLFEENKMPLTKSNNDRIDGWLAVKELLKVVTGVDGLATSRLKIFRNCINLIRTLPMLQFDEKNPNDVANKPHELTHAPDALRYFAIGWTGKAILPSDEKQYNFSSEKPKQKPTGYGEDVKVW